MTAISWKSTVSGNWSTASDWSPAQVPGLADDVTIAVTGANYTLTVTTAHATPSLTERSANANLSVSSALAMGGLLTLSAGQLTLSSGGIRHWSERSRAARSMMPAPVSRSTAVRWTGWRIRAHPL